MTENQSNPAVVIEPGESSSSSVSFLISAKHADEMTYVLARTDDVAPASTAEGLFAIGEVRDGTLSSSVIVDKLMPETSYTVYAAARAGEVYSQMKTCEIATVEQPTMISFVSSTKTGFTYRIENIADNQAFFHTYFEKWAYDEVYEQYKEGYGEEFDKNVMLQNMLADYGFEATGPQDIRWNAGDENMPREGIATIVGGKPYYAVSCLVDLENGNWIGNPQEITFSTQPAGVSSANIKIVIEELTTEQLLSRIEPDPTIRFYYYHLFNKSVVDAYVAESGQEAFENYIYENGYIGEEEYTDRWKFSEPGETYLLAVVGVDMEGNTMYADQIVDAPKYVPEVAIQVQPYENELQGYYDYQSIEVAVAPMYFGETPVEPMMWTMQPKEAIDGALESFGCETIEECVMNGYIYMYPQLAEEWSTQLNASGSFIAYFNDLDPETEYYFIVMLEGPDGNPVVSYGSAKTKAKQAVTEPEAEYRAFLGNWTLTGQSTESWSWSNPIVYNLKIEQLTANRSFRVSGWSNSAVGTEHPFVMNYDPQTKKAYVRAPQSLGTYTDGETDYEAVFTGLFIYGMTDDLSLLYGTSYTAFTCSINGNSLSMSPEIFDYDGQAYSFISMGYSGRTPEGTFAALTGDEYNPVYFNVVRATTAKVPAVRTLKPAGLGLKRDVVLFMPSLDAMHVTLRPVVPQIWTVPAYARRISPAFAEKMAANPESSRNIQPSPLIRGIQHLEQSR